MDIDHQSILQLNPQLSASWHSKPHLSFDGAWTGAKNYVQGLTVVQSAMATARFVSTPIKSAEQKLKTTTAYQSASSFVHKHPEMMVAGLALAITGDIYWARSDFASVASNGSVLHLINGLSTITLGLGKNAYLLKGAIALVANKHGWEMMGLRPTAPPLSILSPSPR